MYKRQIILSPFIKLLSMSTKFVLKLLGMKTEDEEEAVTEEEVKALGVDLGPGTVEVNFGVGDQVQVSGTAMDGFVGIVQKINIEDGTVEVLVSMFGRETQATLALNQVIRLDD